MTVAWPATAGGGEGAFPLAVIADEVGYASPFAFAHAFENESPP
jgi:hypothetical protein